MKHIGRKALLAVAVASLTSSGFALLAANTVSPSNAGVATVPFPARTTTPPTTPASCYAGSLNFFSSGSSSPADGGIECTAASAGNVIVNVKVLSGSASTCTDIRFTGSPLKGPVEVPLNVALQASGAPVGSLALASGDTYSGAAKLSGCTGPADLIVSYTLTVIA